MLDPDSPLEPAHGSLFGQLAAWSDARLPLPEMLRALAEEYGGRSRRGLEATAERVERGDSLDEAFEHSSRLFPRRLRSQLALAARRGDIRTALPAIAAQQATEQQVRRDLASSLLYPAVVLLFAVFVTLFAAWFVLPAFDELFGEFDLLLPEITEVVLVVMRYAPAVIGGSLASVGLLAMLAIIPSTARMVHWLIGAVPLFGTLWIWVSHRSFAQQLSAYLSAGMPMDAAIECVAAGLSDQNLAWATNHVRKACAEGARLSAAMERSLHFERPLVAFVRLGETDSTLAAAMAEASDVYRRQIDLYLAFIARVVPPFMVVVVGGGILIAAMSLLVPLVSLVENLS